jgi:hypothetical protein
MASLVLPFTLSSIAWARFPITPYPGRSVDARTVMWTAAHVVEFERLCAATMVTVKRHTQSERPEKSILQKKVLDG